MLGEAAELGRGTVVDSDEIQEAVAIEVDRRELVVVAESGDPGIGRIGERAGAVVHEQVAAVAELARSGDVEVPVVVDVDELEVPAEGDERVGHRSALTSTKPAAPSFSQSWTRPPSLSGPPVAPVREHHVQVTIAVHVAEPRSPMLSSAAGSCVSVTSAHAASLIQQEPGLAVVGRAEHDLVEAIGVQVGDADDAGDGPWSAEDSLVASVNVPSPLFR